jgi:hypothetical protein
MPKDNLDAGRIYQAIMDSSENSTYPHYLAAKKSIDDRALNYHVWKMLHRALPQATKGKPLSILEIGAGIGTMLVRAVERGLVAGPSTYVATDSDAGQLRAARQYLSRWAQQQGHSLSWSGENRCRLRTARADVSVVFDLAGAETLAERSNMPGPCHLLIAHAVLDLIDFPSLLPRLLLRLSNNGLALLTCNFDGETVFLPECEGDEEIIRRYHASMEERLAGASHTGRRLLSFMQRPGIEILAAGGSDWVIHPWKTGYSTDETDFLHAIIETVEQELGKKDSPPVGLGAWARLRRQQIKAGRLSFLARNLDLLVRRRGYPS